MDLDGMDHDWSDELDQFLELPETLVDLGPPPLQLIDASLVQFPPPQPPPPEQYQNAWVSYKQTTLYQKFLHLPFSLPEPISRAMLEQIATAEASHLGPGPNFGPYPRDWAERLVELPLAAPAASPMPLKLIGTFPMAADPRVETEQKALVERVLAALHGIQSQAALQMLTDQVATLDRLRNEIVNALVHLNQLTAIVNSTSEMLLAANQLELQNLHSRAPALINLFQQLCQDAGVALRFAANVLVLRVVEWRTEQRRLANRAETREKRHQQGQYVKALPGVRLELDRLARQIVTFGQLMGSFVAQAQMLRDALPMHISNAAGLLQPLNLVMGALVSSLPLLAEHTLVFVHQPLQVLKKGNLLAFTVLWLAGPVLHQLVTDMPHPLLRAQLVPEDGLSGKPNLNPPRNQRAPHLTNPSSKMLGPHVYSVAGGQNTGWGPDHYLAHEAKFSKLRYVKPGKDDEDDSSVGEGSISGTVNSHAKGHAARNAQRARVCERLHFLVVESGPIAQLAQVQLRAVSLPIVLTVSVNQEEHAMCTVMWRNAFCCDDEVPWTALRDELSAVFEGRTTVTSHVGPQGNQTQVLPGRGIAPDQLENIRQRHLDAVLNGNGAQNAAAAAATGALTVKYSDFMYKNIPRKEKAKDVYKERAKEASKEKAKDGVGFTVWGYVYSALKLVLDAPLTTRLWFDGVIYGFVSKEQAGALLREKAPAGSSAMCVRFSETQAGAVSLGRYLSAPGSTPDWVDPWSRDALAKEPLVDRLLKKSAKFQHVLVLSACPGAAQARHENAPAVFVPEIKRSADMLSMHNPSYEYAPNEPHYGYHAESDSSNSLPAALTHKSTHQLIRDGEQGSNF